MQISSWKRTCKVQGGGLKIPRNSLENEVDFQFPKTSRNSKFFSVFISGRIQVRPEGNSVQPFVLPGFYFLFFFPRKSRRGMFHWEYLVPFRVGIVLWNHAGSAGSDFSWRECWALGRSLELWEHIPIPAFYWDESKLGV